MNINDYLGKIINVKMDRKLGSRHPKAGFFYMLNYGFVPDTISGDGAEIDAYILGVFEPTEEFVGEVIAIIKRTDEDDPKLIVVPPGKSYSDDQIKALTEFQERFHESIIVR